MIINTKRKLFLNFPFNEGDKIKIICETSLVTGRIVSESNNQDYIVVLDLKTNEINRYYYDFISYIEILEDEFHNYRY
ncbi:hypothetical protein DVV91_10110 [Clostridium botulinum]|uniref:hypothetical protein n=1 Tax=Clostridium botulinum TaxID=1491 RepID=UPI000A16EF1B|nr:hypothetical protein [Clostridium botulinum]MBN1074695.1 hypothetical protein [Clostridium botulinum]